jgi:glycosyltransferase involved in cell wall biosynthesis
MLWFSSRLKWDIALAPLEDTYFNQCKSDLKFLDYAAIGAAGIYSAIGPYNRSVSHLETGWLVKRDMAAWVDAIETLMVDYKLRFKIAHNAAAYLNNKRTLKSQAEKWLKAIRWILKEN